jgi:hypothetical protein
MIWGWLRGKAYPERLYKTRSRILFRLNMFWPYLNNEISHSHINDSLEANWV